MNKKKCKEEVREEILARAKLLRGELVRGELLTVDEAAEYIRMGIPTLYENIDQIAHFSPPKGVKLFDSAVLDEWLKNSFRPAVKTPGRNAKEAAV